MAPAQRSWKRRVGDYAAYILIRVFICVIQALSLDACHSLARSLAWLAKDVLRFRRKTVCENLAKAFPEATERERAQMQRRMWTHLFLMLFEIAHAPRKLHRSNWRKHVRLRSADRLVMRMLDERPALTVTGHYGNFEMAGYLSGLFGFPTYTIARPLDNPYLHDYVNRFRGATGQFILPKEGSAQDVQRVLDDGETIALLADQYAGPKGCWVEMFGQPTSCHKAVALFSLGSGAPMLVAHAKRVDDRPLHFELGSSGEYDPQDDVERRYDVRSLSQWYVDHLEAVIRESPDQYWWVHRIWRGEPPKRRKRNKAA